MESLWSTVCVPAVLINMTLPDIIKHRMCVVKANILLNVLVVRDDLALQFGSSIVEQMRWCFYIFFCVLHESAKTKHVSLKTAN